MTPVPEMRLRPQSVFLVTFSVMMPSLVFSTAWTMAVLRAYWASAWPPGNDNSRAIAPSSATGEKSFRMSWSFRQPGRLPWETRWLSVPASRRVWLFGGAGAATGEAGRSGEPYHTLLTPARRSRHSDSLPCYALIAMGTIAPEKRSGPQPVVAGAGGH